MAVEIVKPGLETTVQDYPGRLGHLAAGFPPSGPMDHWSFRLANLLVGNDAGAPALECQFIGPSLRFRAPAVVAVTGADMAATLEGSPVERWTSQGAGRRARPPPHQRQFACARQYRHAPQCPSARSRHGSLCRADAAA